MSKNLDIIGRKDHIDLPEFELLDLEAKIDTGAYGCALHCHQIGLHQQGEIEVLQFNILDPQHSNYENKPFQTKDFQLKNVKNSSGQSEERFVIQTKMILFQKVWKVEFSLTDRSSMKYPILLGRKFLSKHFLVDVSVIDLSFNLKKANNENSSIV